MDYTTNGNTKVDGTTNRVYNIYDVVYPLYENKVRGGILILLVRRPSFQMASHLIYYNHFDHQMSHLESHRLGIHHRLGIRLHPGIRLRHLEAFLT